MEDYYTPAIAYTDIEPVELYQRIDEVITSRGGRKPLCVGSDFHAYEIPYKGAILVSISDPPTRATFNNCQGRIDKPISGIAQLVGFQFDEFYRELYKALSGIQQNE